MISISMKKNSVLVFMMFVLSLSLVCAGSYADKAECSNGYAVFNVDTGLGYSTIQSAIDAQQTVAGHMISVKEGTYYESVVITKSVSLVGENRNNTVIIGNEGDVVVDVKASNAAIKGFTIRNGNIGVYVVYSNDSLVTENILINTTDAIHVSYSGNCMINQNIVENNGHRGIFVTNSWNFTISDNYVRDSGWYGINANASIGGLIAGNNAGENHYDGIGLGSNCSNCTIARNNVKNNTLYGVWLDSDSGGNSIYHNNIADNGIQAIAALANHWDDGIEGNYWSNYTGVDLDRDGIGDTVHVLDSNNTDHYPLMSIFSRFNTPYDYQVDIVSNSSISHLDFSVVGPYQAMLTFNATGDTGTRGFCRICIPKALINSSYVVKLNGETITEPQVRQLPCSNETLEYLYINYTHSEHTIEISGPTPIPEFPSFLFPALFMTTTLLAVAVYRRRIEGADE